MGRRKRWCYMTEINTPEKLDRTEFAGNLAVQNRKMIRKLRMIAVSLAVCLYLWFLALCHGNTGLCILLLIIMLFILLSLQWKCRVFCHRCGAAQDGRFNWYTGKQSLIETHDFLADGHCGYCRAEMFTTPKPKKLQLTLAQLWGGRKYFTVNFPLFLCLMLGAMLLLFCSIFSLEAMTVTSLATATVAIFFEVSCCLLLLRQTISPRELLPLPCPKCGGDLNRYNYRRIARETGGCGYCGAQIVADFIPEPIPPTLTDEERNQKLAARTKDGRNSIIFGYCLLAGGFLWIALLWFSSPYWGKLAISDDLEVLYLMTSAFWAGGIVSIVLGKKQKRTGVETVQLFREGFVKLQSGELLLDRFPDNEKCAELLERWKVQHRPRKKTPPESPWIALGKMALLSVAMLAIGIIVVLVGGDKDILLTAIGGGLLGIVCIPITLIIMLCQKLFGKRPPDGGKGAGE